MFAWVVEIVTFPLPSTEAEPLTAPLTPIVLAVPHLLVVIFWLPSKLVPLIVRAVCSFVAVAALPVHVPADVAVVAFPVQLPADPLTFPVTFPVRFPVIPP